MTGSDAAAAVTNCKTTNNATIKIHLQRGTKKEIKRKKTKKADSNFSSMFRP